MLLPRHRPSLFVALAIALTVFGQSGWFDQPSERDSYGHVIRVRTGPQRQDHAHGAAHESDADETIAPTPGHVELTRIDVHAPPGRAVTAAGWSHAGPTVDFVLLTPGSPRSHALFRPHRPTLGRAPPTLHS